MDILKNISKTSRRILVIGWAAAAVVLTASAAVYFGAGKIFDYYPSMALCAKLLTAVRPVFVLSSAASLAAEYFNLSRQK